MHFFVVFALLPLSEIIVVAEASHGQALAVCIGIHYIRAAYGVRNLEIYARYFHSGNIAAAYRGLHGVSGNLNFDICYAGAFTLCIQTAEAAVTAIEHIFISVIKSALSASVTAFSHLI